MWRCVSCLASVASWSCHATWWWLSAPVEYTWLSSTEGSLTRLLASLFLQCKWFSCPLVWVFMLLLVVVMSSFNNISQEIGWENRLWYDETFSVSVGTLNPSQLKLSYTVAGNIFSPHLTLNCRLTNIIYKQRIKIRTRYCENSDFLMKLADKHGPQ